MSILLGNGDGSFAPPFSFGAGRFPRGIAASDLDLDLDGLVDLVNCDEDGGMIRVFLDRVGE